MANCPVIRPDPVEVAFSKLIAEAKLDADDARENILRANFDLQNEKGFAAYVDELQYIMFLEAKIQKYEEFIAQWRLMLYGNEQKS